MFYERFYIFFNVFTSWDILQKAINEYDQQKVIKILFFPAAFKSKIST